MAMLNRNVMDIFLIFRSLVCHVSKRFESFVFTRGITITVHKNHFYKRRAARVEHRRRDP